MSFVGTGAPLKIEIISLRSGVQGTPTAQYNATIYYIDGSGANYFSIVTLQTLVGAYGTQIIDPNGLVAGWGLYSETSVPHIMLCWEYNVISVSGQIQRFKSDYSTLTSLQSSNPNNIGQAFQAADCVGSVGITEIFNFIQTSPNTGLTYVRVTITDPNGVPRDMTLIQQDAEKIVADHPNNVIHYEGTNDPTGVQPLSQAESYITGGGVHHGIPPETLVNNLVTVQTACGVKRVIMTDSEFQSFSMGNFLPAPAPTTLSYDMLGKVSEGSSYNSFLQQAASCYHTTAPPPTGGHGITGGSLSGITMLLLALGALIKRG